MIGTAAFHLQTQRGDFRADVLLSGHAADVDTWRAFMTLSVQTILGEG